MKTILQVSDLHTEFSKIKIEDWPRADCLALCGDIGVGMAHRELIENILNSRKYKWVFLVTGNHEYYNQCKEDVDTRWREFAEENIDKGFVFLDGTKTYLLDDYVIAGCTLWTNLDSPEIQAYAQYAMNDFKMITSIQSFDPKDGDTFYKKVAEFDLDNPSTWASGHAATKIKYVNGVKAKPLSISAKLTNVWHMTDVKYLEYAVQQAKDLNKKLIVFTHHTPHKVCLNEKHAGGALDKAYYTDLEWLMKDVFLWGCGHTHNRVDTTINGCRLIMNGRGYVFNQTQEEIPGFKPKVITLE